MGKLQVHYPAGEVRLIHGKATAVRGEANITFPAGTFSTAPVFLCNAQGDSFRNVVLVTSTIALTQSGATVDAWYWDNKSNFVLAQGAVISWIAIGG